MQGAGRDLVQRFANDRGFGDHRVANLQQWHLSQRGYRRKLIRPVGKIDVTEIMGSGLLAEHDDCALDAEAKVVADQGEIGHHRSPSLIPASAYGKGGKGGISKFCKVGLRNLWCATP